MIYHLHHKLSMCVVILYSVAFLGLPNGVRLEEESDNDLVFRDEKGNVRGGLGRVKRLVADNSDLVVDKKYPMTKNKEIKGLSEVEKQTMLHMHNAYRSLVRPLAANMIELTWDDRIAAFAQEWANQCTATHRKSRTLQPWVGMGENLYWWYSGSYNVATSVKWWWDEVQHYTIQSKHCTPGKLCGHYITMVWGKTERIGCGVARCDRLEDLPQYKRGSYYYVCNYSGRFLSNTKPYIATDMPCSSCYKTNFPKCRYNLCVTQEMIDNDIGYNGDTTITGLNRSETFSHPKSTPEKPQTTKAPPPPVPTTLATESQTEPTTQPTKPITQPTTESSGSNNGGQQSSEPSKSKQNNETTNKNNINQTNSNNEQSGLGGAEMVTIHETIHLILFSLSLTMAALL